MVKLDRVEHTVEIPEGVTLENNQGVITFTGKLGNLSLEIHEDVDINKVADISNKKINYEIIERRDGDPGALYAKSNNILDFFQIWINLPSYNKRVEPNFQMYWNKQIPKINVKDKLHNDII